MAKQLTNEQRAQIVILLSQGIGPKQVSNLFNINRSSVVRVRQKYLTYNTYDHLKTNGRPKKLSSSVLAEIFKEINDNPKQSLRQITNNLQNRLNMTISVSSVKNGLNYINKFAYSPVSKPLLSKKNIKARFEFSKLVFII